MKDSIEIRYLFGFRTQNFTAREPGSQITLKLQIIKYSKNNTPNEFY